ncbi:MAG: Twinfilin-1 [Pycnora praestabilis]|nr:MAG: Twinfilin-1 [Pycnora praestabilis]
MQSGISASQELHGAFNDLVSNPSQRGILASIKNEQLIPLESISSSSSDFVADLPNLLSLLKDNEAVYIILRRYADAPDGFVAVTYVPDTANVRQKMLFASTRLTLVRELGTERFRETIFATTRAELTAEGWQKHHEHGELKAPLTKEEETLQDVKEAEASASKGTSAKSSHVSSGVGFPISEEAMRALKGLDSDGDNLVQLRIDIPNETIELADTNATDAEGLASAISDSEPRYSFFRYTHDYEGQEQAPIVFIYTCPSGSKIKERMVYASSRAGMVNNASTQIGLTIVKKLEASSPSEINASTIHDEFHPKQEMKSGFSRPKRPGKR